MTQKKKRKKYRYTVRVFNIKKKKTPKAKSQQVPPTRLVVADKVQSNLGEALLLKVRYDGLPAQTTVPNHAHHLPVLLVLQRELEQRLHARAGTCEGGAAGGREFDLEAHIFAVPWRGGSHACKQNRLSLGGTHTYKQHTLMNPNMYAAPPTLQPPKETVSSNLWQKRKGAISLATIGNE